MESHISRNIEPGLNGQGSTENFERESWKNSLNRMYTDVNRLMQKEGELIRVEMNEKLAEIKGAVVSLVAAGVVAFVGLVSLAATATLLLNLVAPLWLASVIVTVAFLLIGAIMLGMAKKKLGPEHLKPTKSIEAFGEIRHSLKEKVHEITKH